MTGGIEVSQRLEHWAKLADYALTSGSSTTDGRPMFWSALGETRLFIGRRQDGWFVVTDSDRMESEKFVLAALSLETIEKYLFGRFGTYIRSARDLPRVGVAIAANELSSKFSIETREYDGVERFALIAPDGSTVAIGNADKVTATAELTKLALYVTSTIDQIEASAIDPERKAALRAMKELSMDPAVVNAAIVVAISDTAVPHIDKEKLVEVYGQSQAESLIARVSELVHEAVSMPLERGDMTLAEGVNDILRRFHEKHLELSQEALHEIGRCVGWNLR